jgi:hypothetical protein
VTELQFLIDLLLNHKVPSATKKLIADRIGEVETKLMQPSVYIPPGRPINNFHPPTAQSPSTQRILDEMALEMPPVQPATVAQTPAAAQALAQRAETIRIATSGKEERGRTSPRKF